MKQLIHNPIAVLGAYYFASALISGMPAPVSTDGKGYRWLYSTLHIFAANFDNISKQWKNGGNPFGPVVVDQAKAASAGKYSV
jgi:hypothetical protein